MTDRELANALAASTPEWPVYNADLPTHARQTLAVWRRSGLARLARAAGGPPKGTGDALIWLPGRGRPDGQAACGHASRAVEHAWPG